MFSYFFVLVAVFSRILPHPWFSFTAVGASLLVFGARRSPKLFILPVLVLAAVDYYLTVFAYNYPFHVQDYLVTWAWYLGACWMGYAFLRKRANAGRVVGAALASSTSFFWPATSPSGPAPWSTRTPQVAWRLVIWPGFRSIATMFWRRHF